MCGDTLNCELSSNKNGLELPAREVCVSQKKELQVCSSAEVPCTDKNPQDAYISGLKLDTETRECIFCFGESGELRNV